MSTLKINKLCIIGVGSIGGSIACALRTAGCVNHITGVGRHLENLQQAKNLNVIDDFATDIKSAVTDADIVIVATPLGAMQNVFSELATCLPENCVLTDVGSAKQHVVNAVQTAFGDLPKNFVPGHPIAGTEKSGVEAAYAELFKDRRVILTPHANTDKAALNTIRLMWEKCGAELIEMEPRHHDEVLAETSHLPHMLAYALVDTLARMDDSQEIFEFAAGGFRDFTRIASSDPQMWHDICVANREQLANALHAFNEDLQRLTRAVEQADSEYLKETFTRAKNARDKFCG
jgi:prephenate dehydrogenase